MSSTSPGLNTTSTTSDISRAPRMVFLTLFMIMSSVGSLLLIIVIVHSRKHRTIQNLLIANVCVVCFIDTFLNMSLVMGSLIVDHWAFGDFMCKVNCFFLNLVNIETVLLLMSLSVDRYFSLRHSLKYEAWLFSYRIYLIIAYLWLHAAAFSIPFLTDAVSSQFRPQLHLCSVTGDTSVVFVYLTLIICFLAPLVSIVVFQILIVRVTCELRNSKRTQDPHKNYTQMLNETPLSDSVVSHPSCYTRILFVLWLILNVPFVITSSIKHYEQSQGVEESQFLDYPWEVDAVFIWMKFFFSAIFPFVTFFCKKDLWQSTKECVLCRRNNSIIDIEVVGLGSDTNVSKDKPPNIEVEFSTPKNKEKEREKAEVSHILAFSVPVLFATSTGICIEDKSSEHVTDTSSLSQNELAITAAIKGKKLDISYSDPEWPEELIGDTSDYDSSCEIDQYSSSQPVSTRNVHGTLHRTRSLSDPEIAAHPSPNKAKVVKRFSGTSGADSGLDLSGTSGTNTGKLISATVAPQGSQPSPCDQESAVPSLVKINSPNASSLLKEDVKSSKTKNNDNLASKTENVDSNPPSKKLTSNKNGKDIRTVVSSHSEEIKIKQIVSSEEMAQKGAISKETTIKRDCSAETVQSSGKSQNRLPTRLKPIEGKESPSPKVRRKKHKIKRVGRSSNTVVTPGVAKICGHKDDASSSEHTAQSRTSSASRTTKDVSNRTNSDG
ncbi:uncharacterized protein LOC101852289 [Aplysia californica]|uniref:Uncharacterized protein LOC101852289 n=1 Tax=Aplysia californica TaxID=6500 RepID=A0ABM0JAW7_APLCA|nr:uncharacterized protein LOC101852289 [Aplysia californica]XP_005089481.1 uncharacterized protein LOC101852289 [Aplysia californica]